MASASSLIISSITPVSFSLNCVSIPISYTQHNSFKKFSFDKRLNSLSSSSTSCINPLYRNGRNPKILIVKAAEYKFPDPIPEFAEAETEKFKSHLVKRLTTKEIFEDSVDEVIGICTEIFTTFLQTEYGGPGTLLVEPFIDMAYTINERGLPGGPQAARAAVKWAQNHVDKDWKEWTAN